MTHPDRRHGSALDSEPAAPTTAPFSDRDREIAREIAAALALPQLPACQALHISDGSRELLSSVIRATPNLLTLGYAPASSSNHPITSSVDPPFAALRLTCLTVDILDSDTLKLALRLITASQSTLTSLELRPTMMPDWEGFADFVQLCSTVTYPSLQNLRYLSIPVMVCPPPSVGSGVTRMSISYHEDENLERGRSRV